MRVHPEGMLMCEEYSDTLVNVNKNVITPTRKSKYSRILVHQGRNKEEFMKKANLHFITTQSNSKSMRQKVPLHY